MTQTLCALSQGARICSRSTGRTTQAPTCLFGSSRNANTAATTPVTGLSPHVRKIQAKVVTLQKYVLSWDELKLRTDVAGLQGGSSRNTIQIYSRKARPTLLLLINDWALKESLHRALCEHSQECAKAIRRCWWWRWHCQRWRGGWWWWCWRWGPLAHIPKTAGEITGITKQSLFEDFPRK